MRGSRRVIALVLMLFGALTTASPAETGPSDRPNIVVFLVDDMGWQDTSVAFHASRTPQNKKFRTPNMERLAATGMKFTQAYASCVCSPSRISLVTGLNAARHRVTNWTLRMDTGTDAKHPTLDFPGWNVNGLSPRPGIARTVQATPLPELLKQAGYRTIHVGKAHFGAAGTPGADPRNLGFDVNIAGHAAGGPGSYLGEQNFSGAWRKADRIWDVPGLEAYHGKDIFLTEALTIEAMAQIDRAIADRKPFFLYMAHYAVHVPFAADRRFVERYRAAGLGEIEAMYAAMVEGMDKSLGDIMHRLEFHGIAEQTVVIFLSDNGGLSAHGRGGTPHKHNGPLSSGKGSAREGGIRVPWIVRWPSVTAPGSSCPHPVIIEDIFPTVLELAGAKNWHDRVGRIDGLSLVPLLRGHTPTSERSLLWHFPNSWGPKGPGIGPSSTLRKGDWKLIYYHTDRSYDLFNIASDLGENTNLADAEPARRTAMAKELASLLKEANATMPVVRSTGQPVPWPGESPEDFPKPDRYATP
ncbi:MAG TPA: sulfatase [Verrucomicrobiae bacterium]|nr:sulfatase [Verrucomicrobiae bacterium]